MIRTIFNLIIFDSLIIMTSRKAVEEIVEQIKRKEKVQEIAIQKLCETAKDILKDESNVIKVRSPVTICGDIHGQLDDLL